jgi:hypothetical protein
MFTTKTTFGLPAVVEVGCNRLAVGVLALFVPDVDHAGLFMHGAEPFICLAAVVEGSPFNTVSVLAESLSTSG